jgi:hypothetical protein
MPGMKTEDGSEAPADTGAPKPSTDEILAVVAQLKAAFRESHPPTHFELERERLTLAPELPFKDEGCRWSVEWRGERRVIDGGTLVLLDSGEEKPWRTVLPHSLEDAPRRPKRVPDSFAGCPSEKAVDWSRPWTFLQSADDRKSERCLIGILLVEGPSHWQKLLDAPSKMVQSEYKRTVYRPALLRTLKAARKLEDLIKQLQRLEEQSPLQKYHLKSRELQLALAAASARSARERGDTAISEAQASEAAEPSWNGRKLRSLRGLSHMITQQLDILSHVNRGSSGRPLTASQSREERLMAVGMSYREIAEILQREGLGQAGDGPELVRARARRRKKKALPNPGRNRT